MARCMLVSLAFRRRLLFSLLACFLFAGHHQHRKCTPLRLARLRGKPWSRPTGAEIPSSEDFGLFHANLGKFQHSEVVAAKAKICSPYLGYIVFCQKIASTTVPVVHSVRPVLQMMGTLFV